MGDANDGTTLPLFGYHLKSPVPSLLSTLKVLIKVDLPFTDQLSSATCALLAQCAPTILRQVCLQAHYIGALLFALETAPYPHQLYPASLLLVTLPGVDLQSFFERIQSLPDLRYEIWRKIREQEISTGLSVEEDQPKLLHLLTPIEGLVSLDTIQSSLGARYPDGFLQEIEQLSLTSTTTKHILRLLRQEPEPSANSKKRKRLEHQHSSDPIRELLGQLVPPDLYLHREDYMSDLAEFVKEWVEVLALLMFKVPRERHRADRRAASALQYALRWRQRRLQRRIPAGVVEARARLPSHDRIGSD